MAKRGLKKQTSERQNGISAVSEEILPDDTALFDTHRPFPRSEGGTYTEENTVVVLPVEHQIIEGNEPRIDDPGLVELRAIMEDYRTCVKIRLKINNHKLAVERGIDMMTPEIETMFEKLLNETGKNEKHFKKSAEKKLREIEMPIVKIMENIKGVGPITIAELITTINITIARHPSSLWKYCGYHTSAKDRYVKGEKGGGNKQLRSVLYNLAVSFMRCANEDYTDVYYRRKEKTSHSEKTILHKATRKSSWVEMAWKDVNPGRRHNDALRVMIKHFLADLWMVWRTIEGLPTEPLYVEAQLGHTSIIQPHERGWEF